MPVGPGGDQNGIDIFAVEQFVEVAVLGAVLVAILRVGHLFHGITAALLHVADGSEHHVGL